MISIIIPAYNASKTLYKCLNSIFNLNYKNYEVLVVDDCSTDDSIGIAKKFNIKLIKLEVNSGPAICRNKGAENAKGDILAFTDTDCEVPKDWLKKAEKILIKNKDVAAITGPYSKPAKSNFISKFQHYDILYSQRNAPEFTQSCTTSNLLCKKGPFFEIGGFPDTRINEDMEFASKLSKKYKIYWMKDNGVIHDYKSKFKDYFKQQKNWAKGTILSYLSKPYMLFEKSNFDKSNIILQMVLTLLSIFFIIFTFIDIGFLIIDFILLLLIIAINIRFLLYLKKQESFKFSFLSMGIILVRNVTWMYGLAIGEIIFLKIYLKN